jgi:transcriptional regulator EpsA
LTPKFGISLRPNPKTNFTVGIIPITVTSAVDSWIDDSLAIQGPDLGRLVSVIDASLKVRRRHQLFLWIQGVFQSMLAHESLICALNDFDSRSVDFDHFSITEGREEFFADLCDRNGGMMQRLIKLWTISGFRPLLMDTSPSKASYDSQIAATLANCHLNNLAAHGTFNARGEVSSFFCFLNVDSPIPPNVDYSLELIIPFLSAAYIRTKLEPGPVDRSLPFSNKVLTSRQAEILFWVQQGKSNAEIGDILTISALTVKNHVQKILRKLNVQNRAQAVGKGLSLNLMKASTET